jgi:hypothetical protein
MTATDLDAIRKRRDAYRDAYALVLRTGEPDSDRAAEYPAARDGWVWAAAESAGDVPALIAEVDRLRAELAAVRAAHALAVTDLDTLTAMGDPR